MCKTGSKPASEKSPASGLCAAHGATSTLRYERRYPATVNHADETEVAGRAAALVVGADNLIHDPMPSMASEDFAFMLNACPGNYVWLGTGDGPNLHSPLYDFNDEALVYGAGYWVALVKTALP